MLRHLFSHKTYRYYLPLLLVALASLLFTNISYDGEYQLAMAYRFYQGDAMITQMWEPHQTSAFLCFLLMKLYIGVTHTTTGIVLFTQFAGLLIRGGIAVSLYRALRNITDETPAVLAGLFYLLISPKDVLTPEFGNMQLWFSTLLFLSLWNYFREKRLFSLIFAALHLCLAVLSYPSMLIAYFAAVLLLWKHSEKKGRDIAIFTAVCAAVGGAFAGYLLFTVGLPTILTCVSAALSLEPSHTVSLPVKFLEHLKNAALLAALLLFCACIGKLAEQILFTLHQKKNTPVPAKEERSVFALFLSFTGLLLFSLYFILIARERNAYAVTLLFFMVVGFCNRKKLSKTENQFYMGALTVSLCNLLATLLLSDHAVLQSIPYTVLFLCASVLPLYRLYLTQKNNLKSVSYFRIAIHALLLLLFFRCIYLHIPIRGRSQMFPIISDGALIRSGPAFGIYTDEAGAAAQRDSMEEWKTYIRSGDKIWLIGEPVDTLGYLYEDVEVAAPSVMSTPSYNEALTYYFTLNPDKMPDVLILASSFGELALELSGNEWLMNWIDEEYRPETVIDGNYWRYYYKEKPAFLTQE